MPLPTPPPSIPVDSSLVAAIKAGQPTDLADPARPFRGLLRARFGQVEQILGVQRAVVTALDAATTAVAAAQTSLTDVRAQVASLATRVTSVEGKIPTLATLATVSGLSARLADLESRFNAAVGTGGGAGPTTPPVTTTPTTPTDPGTGTGGTTTPTTPAPTPTPTPTASTQPRLRLSATGQIVRQSPTTLTPTPTPAPSGLFDAFDAADSARWDGYGIGANDIYVTGGDAVINCTPNYYKLKSRTKWNFTTGSFTAVFSSTPAKGNGTTAMFLEISPNDENRISFGVTGGAFFQLERFVDNVRRPDQQAPYDPTHKVYRARRSGADIVFETSPDGSAWTTRFTIPATPTPLSVVKINLASGYYGTEPAPGAARFASVATTCATTTATQPVYTPAVTTPAPAPGPAPATGTGAAWRPYVHQPAGIGTAVSLKWGSATGARCKLNGVNVWGIPVYDATHANHAKYMYDNRVAAMDKIKAMGANIIRLRVDAIVEAYNQASWGISQAEVLNRVAAWVELARARGMVTMICNWDAYNAAGNWGNVYTQSFALFTALVNRLGKDNPYVIYEFANEPNNLEQFQAGWFTAVRGTISHFRDTLGYTGPLVVDPTGWAHNYSDTAFTQIEQHDAARAVMGGKHQLMWARHDYGNEYAGNTWSRDKWYGDTGGAQNDHLIFETEFGKYNINTASSDAWTRGASAYFSGQGYVERANHVGAVAFLAGPWRDNGTIGNGMTVDGSVTTLTPWGDVVDQVLLTAAAVEGTPAVGA